MGLYRNIKLQAAKIPIVHHARIPVLAFCCRNGIAALQASWKMNKVFSPAAQALIDSGKPIIYAVFHGRMFGMLSIPNRERTLILISESRDGEMIARAMTSLGFCVARGSIAHGAFRAAKTMLANLRAGKNVVITVDGPRGPALEVKPAVIRLAQTSQVPIIPMVSDARRKKHYKSWDSFMFPHFFNQTLCIYGEPIHVPPEASIEDQAAALGTVMEKLRSDAKMWADGVR